MHFTNYYWADLSAVMICLITILCKCYLINNEWSQRTINAAGINASRYLELVLSYYIIQSVMISRDYKCHKMGPANDVTVVSLGV